MDHFNETHEKWYSANIVNFVFTVTPLGIHNMRQREEIGTLNNYIQSNLDAEQISKQLIGSSKLETFFFESRLEEILRRFDQISFICK